MSGDDPTAMLASVFCRAPSLPPLKSSFTWILGCEAFQVATWAVIAFASTSVYPCDNVMWTTPPDCAFELLLLPPHAERNSATTTAVATAMT